MTFAAFLSILTASFLCCCVLCDASPMLLFATNKDIKVANASRTNKVSTIVKDLSQGAVDFYYERNLICWSDKSLEVIQCMRTNGTSAGERTVVINSSMISADGLACDWYTGKLYWTNGENKRIEVTSIDERYRKVLFWTDIYEPRAIAVVPQRKIMFWTDWDEEPKIERAAMDGDPSSREVIVSNDILWPNGLTVDYENELVYWADGKLCFIAVMDYRGKNRRKIISKGLEYPFAITYFEQKLYWTDWTTWSVHSYDVRATQGHLKELFHGEYIPGDIKVWDPRRQPYGDNPCSHSNGNCSHLCLLSTKPQGYSCACPTGVKLVDNYTCANRPEKLLLIVQRTKIFRVSLDSPDYTKFVLPLKDIKFAISIDFDPVSEMLYWSDQEARAIRRSYLDGSGQEDVITKGIINLDGVAVDWIARNLYWIDTGNRRIEVSRLNGTSRKVLVNDDLENPRAIAVAPELGLMFWSDWNEKKPKIERANLDGSDRVPLITKNIEWPNGIALDMENRKVYWCDAKTDKIEVVNMDGTDRREIITDNLLHPFGFTLLGDFLYWTDWERRSIDRVHKQTGGEREVIVEQVADMMGLKAVMLGKISGTSPCAKNNGGCSHLCLNKPNNAYVCACQIGYELKKDQKTCIIPDAFLLYARKENIGRISMENENNDNIIPVTGIEEASSLDVDVSDNRIYWSDTKLRVITRSFMNGSDIEGLIDIGLESPDSVAVDWVAHNLYWSDTRTDRIEIAKVKGTSRKVLIWEDLSEPRSLTLDPEQAFMYWTDQRNSGSIERAALDGSRREIIIGNIGRANGLTIDLTNHVLFWADLFSSSIDSYDLKNKKRKVIVSQNVGYPFSITTYQDYIYWTDWNTGVIERANKTNGLNRTKMHYGLESVTNLLVFHSSRQIGRNPCAQNNGNCSHLCLALPSDNLKPSTTYRCDCPTHYKLAADNRTCIAPRHFMLFSLRNAIGRILPDQDECPDIILREQGLKSVRSIEYDPITQHIYWIEGRHGIRKSLKKKNVVFISAGNGHPFDLAVDPLGRLLFWSCATNDTISVARLDNGSSLGIVVKGEGEKPRHIAVHPEKRLLFWSDINGPVKIMSSKMDGKDRVMIATDMDQLTTFAIDTVGNYVVWANGRNVERADIFGKDRKVLHTISQTGILYMAVLSDHVYYYNKDIDTLERVNIKDGGDKTSVMKKAITDLVSVRTPDDNVMEAHICSPFHDYGGCSHFCIGTTTAKCSCPQSLVLFKDERTCRAVPVCGADHFTCAAPSSAVAKDCIPSTWRCDGQMDCADGSDELGCPACNHDQFKCQSGHCIDMVWVCDGTAQCHDGLDEAHCCSPGQFQCISTGVCIPGSALCDGWDNCADGSDETASACASANNHRQDLDPSVETGKSTYIVSVLVVLGVMIVVVAGFFYSRRKSAINEELPDILHDSAGDPLSPKLSRTAKPLLPQKNGRKELKPELEAMRLSTFNGSSIGSSYDRSHITGASSSTRGSSACGYPQDTLINPPPSPATTANSTRYTSSSASRYRERPYRHYKTINQPPPPTPCSTDVCDESDGNYPPLSNARYRYDDDEICGPPPTPRSVYHSDVPISCPPSPSSRSSTYFSPLPPPPSPVPSNVSREKVRRTNSPGDIRR